MSEVEAKGVLTDTQSDRKLQAVAFLNQALAIADSTGLTVSAARIDHALVTLREEIARQQ